MDKNIFVVGLDLENRTPEEIGREAALKINEIVEGLLERNNVQNNEKSNE